MPWVGFGGPKRSQHHACQIDGKWTVCPARVLPRVTGAHTTSLQPAVLLSESKHAQHSG
jgi:hypothetical protein